METQGYLLFSDGHKEYFEEGIQVIEGSIHFVDKGAFKGCSSLISSTSPYNDDWIAEDNEPLKALL